MSTRRSSEPSRLSRGLRKEHVPSSGKGNPRECQHRRSNPDELRERGVRLALESNRPLAQVAKDLGIQRESLRRWVRQAEADEGKRRDLLTSDERERLGALERENRELRRANEILKAASAQRATLSPRRKSSFQTRLEP